jgi:hypothetical protein
MDLIWVRLEAKYFCNRALTKPWCNRGVAFTKVDAWLRLKNAFFLQAVQVGDLVGITGRLSISGKTVGEGNAEDPYATLAWVAIHLAERGRDLKAGMLAITGSVIPTVSIASGDHALFTVDGLAKSCCCFCLSGRNVGAGHVAGAASSAGRHDHASRLLLRTG